MDARRSQVYNALFRIEDGRPVRLTEDRPIALTELAEELRAYGERAFLVGDGAEMSFRALTEAGIPCALAPENLRMQSAWGVAMAATGKEPGNADTLLPVYLRLSQAERERQERLQRGQEE
jgi:tRNA threonylcarbamoyladenosine biosynthesis protein TsaB